MKVTRIVFNPAAMAFTVDPDHAPAASNGLVSIDEAAKRLQAASAYLHSLQAICIALKLWGYTREQQRIVGSRPSIEEIIRSRLEAPPVGHDLTNPLPYAGITIKGLIGNRKSYAIPYLTIFVQE